MLMLAGILAGFSLLRVPLASSFLARISTVTSIIGGLAFLIFALYLIYKGLRIRNSHSTPCLPKPSPNFIECNCPLDAQFSRSYSSNITVTYSSYISVVKEKTRRKTASLLH